MRARQGECRAKQHAGIFARTNQRTRRRQHAGSRRNCKGWPGASLFGFSRNVFAAIADGFMATRAEKSSAFVHHVRFIGRSGGLVKSLTGFKKSLHTVPDAVNAATSAFLARLCAAELASEAEAAFQRARAVFEYKRKDVTLDATSPNAVLSAKDFTFELAYALDEADPSSWLLTRTLHGLRSFDFAMTQACDAMFADQFSELSFVLTKGAAVEAVIDAVEGLGSGNALKVDYPSDCSRCVLSVPNVSAEVRFEAGELAMVFQRQGTPRELLESFLAVREAFALTKEPVLADLLR